MKILIATDTYKPLVNGVVTSVVNLKAGLEARGHEVRVLALSSTTHSYFQDDTYYIGSYSMSVLYPNVRVKGKRSLKETADIIKWNPDIIHTQSEFSTFYIGRKLAKKLKIPMIHTYHTMYEDYTHYFSPSRRVGKKAVTTGTNYISTRVSGMIAPTEKISRMIEKYGVRCPVSVIPSGIVLEKFKKTIEKSRIDEIKSNLGIPLDHFVMVSISRIGKEKNIDEIIKNMVNLKGRKITLVIVGDGPYRVHLQELAKSLDLLQTVKFTGMVQPSDIPVYYRLGEVFVSASTSETQGLTYIEALASGTPLICRKDECLDGVLEEGENGYCFTNQQEFLDRLEVFMTQENNAMSKKALEIVQKYSIETFAKKVEELYIKSIENFNKPFDV